MNKYRSLQSIVIEIKMFPTVTERKHKEELTVCRSYHCVAIQIVVVKQYFNLQSSRRLDKFHLLPTFMPLIERTARSFPPSSL